MAKRILLADDSLTIQKVVELTFSDSEYDLVCVSNGQRALEKVNESAPDLILADVVMPEKNGYEVCEAIKSNPATARIPVVLLSGTFEPFDRDRAERLGCDAIVSKPFDSQQLLRQVEALLSRAPQDIPSAATMAIPTLATTSLPAPPPPAPAAPERSAPEGGFAPEDFTASIPKPAEIAGGPDLFEEEYGQADVESAIAAFEKAHPEFSYVEEGATTAALSTDDEDGASAVTPPDKDDDEDDRSKPKLASWLQEEREAPSAPEPPVMPAPAPFWVPRQSEPELAPIPFAADDSASRRPSETMRADEGPTQQIPLAADYVAFGRAGASPSRITDETSPPRRESSVASAPEPAPMAEIEEHTAEIPILSAVPPSTPDAASTGGSNGVRRPEELRPVPAEIEELAQTTSIGQLKEMLSSVSRSEGGLSDDEIDRLASRVVERLSEKIVREIAWEVIPDVAELVIKQRIKELEAGAE